MTRLSVVFVSAFSVHAAIAGDGPLVKVGSKSFTESVVLGEMLVQLARDASYESEHVEGLGGTRLVWEALLAGQVDAYVEYTGTLRHELLSDEHLTSDELLRSHLAEWGIIASGSLGFNNTYALGMKRSRAGESGIETISDLADYPELALRFSNEFMQRPDGWPGLKRRYNLPHLDVRGLEHALAYAAIDDEVIDVTDLYVTDAKIRLLDLVALADDLSFFPEYHAVILYRKDLESRVPEAIDAWRRLEGCLDAETMRGLNAAVEINKRSEARAAATFLEQEFNIKTEAVGSGTAGKVARYTAEHLYMVGVSLMAAILLAIPLGVIAAENPRVAQPVLGVVGIIQTIPSIALLVLLIQPVSTVCDWLGISGLGTPQAIVALFLYSLLPIVRNTHSGLTGIPRDLRESAEALGLSRRARRFRIELPLASRTILAGIKTAAVINVGFATLGGFIGAGGFGEPIFTGIRRNDYSTIMLGAIPAALLALAVQGLFELLERGVVPAGLRLKSES